MQILLLLAVAAFLPTAAVALPESPETRHIGAVAEEFCGNESTDAILCPKTGADICRCYLFASHTHEMELFAEKPKVVSVKPKRLSGRVRVINWPPVKKLASLTTLSPLERPPQKAY